jgi:hypothetical protein
MPRGKHVVDAGADVAADAGAAHLDVPLDFRSLADARRFLRNDPFHSAAKSAASLLLNTFWFPLSLKRRRP